jgi:WD40 repeat protein
MDFSPEGTLLAVGGRNCKVRVFDETTKQLAFSMKELAQEPGHSNRIFCVKFNPTNSD